MADDGKKGRGSKPRVQGKSSPTKTQRRIDRTVYGFPSIQAEGPEPPRKANRPRPMATRMPFGWGEGKPSSSDVRTNSLDRPNRPRNVSSRQATLNKPSGDRKSGHKVTEVSKRAGRGSQAGSPSKKGRTVAGQTNPMKGRGGTSGKPKGN